MGKLCIYLPPFAADYSGVCSALYDLNCLTVINDASCCTAHYVYYDEPRWENAPRTVFCTSLRNVDAILGDDEKVIERVCDMAHKTSPSLIAFVGTPVPAIIGMDTAGIAYEVEALTGIPSLGFDTTGFAYYDRGIIMAGKALIRRFAKAPSDEELQAARDERRVNIVGMTPLDHGAHGADDKLVRLLKSAGMKVGARFFMGLTLEQVERCASASLNLAVSSSGITLCRFLERRFGTPYVIGMPQTQKELETLFASTTRDANRVNLDDTAKDAEGSRTLIVADQVVGNSMRARMRKTGDSHPIDVASFFGWHEDMAQSGDAFLRDEMDYLKLLKTGRYTTLAADPLLGNIPLASSLEFVPIVHPAVSSKLYW